MPIRPGDRVMLYLIKRNSWAKDEAFCYVTDQWEPMAFPVLAEYQDYGEFLPVDQESMEAKYIVELLRKNALPQDQGENEYHDIPVDPGKMDWKLINDAVHENRLLVRGMNPERPTVSVAFFPVIEDIWNSMVLPVPTIFDEVLTVPRLAEEINTVLAGKPYTKRQVARHGALMESQGEVKFLAHHLENLIRENLSWLFSCGNGEMSGYAFTRQLVDHKAVSVEAAAKHKLFQASMVILRIAFQPVNGVGGQSESIDFHRHKHLASVISAYTDKVFQSYRDNDWDEESIQHGAVDEGA